MTINKLTPLGIKQASRKRRLNDGGGLYLDVSAGGTKIWLFRWSVLGRQRYLSLGSLANGVTVVQAREEAARLRKLIGAGGDPIVQAREQRAELQAAAVSHKTFAEVVQEYAAAKLETTYRTEKDRNRWRSDMNRYALATLGKLPVAVIITRDIEGVLKPLLTGWKSKPTTAKKLRTALERVLDFATVKNYRQGENPARWRGHLAAVLPSFSKLINDTAQPREMLPFAEVPALMAELRQRTDTAALALRFLILTAVRTGDIVGGEVQVPLSWRHVDGDVWTIPVTKTLRDFPVALCAEALDILATMRARCEDKRVFPGLGENAMSQLLKTLRPGFDVHGFRSSFSTWGSEPDVIERFPRKLVEEALGHATDGKVAGKYNRCNRYLNNRRPLMAAWGAYCAASTVVALRAA